MAAFIFKSISHPPRPLLLRHRYHRHHHIRQKISLSPISVISTNTSTSRLSHGWNWRMKKVILLGSLKEYVSGERKFILSGNLNGYDRRKLGTLKPEATMGSAFNNSRRTEEAEERGMDSSKGAVGVSGDGKEKEEESRGSKLMTLPTVLTLGRVAAVPLLVITFYLDTWWSATATTSIFLAAAVTDWLDGYLARKMRMGTVFGAFLDPVADKLMVAATLVLLCTRSLETSIFGQAHWILAIPSIAIIGREITMSAVREWAASQDSSILEAVAVNNLGKWKTATQMTALTILLASRDASLRGADGLVASGVILLYISAWLAVWSLVVYINKIWRVMLR